MSLIQSNKRRIVDSNEFNVLIEQICRQFVEAHPKALKNNRVKVVGIHTRGVYLAKRITEILKNKYRYNIQLGFLDITLYRDDVGEIGNQPLVKETHIPFSIDNKTVLLVDDVLFTGRTIRAALDALLELGRPYAVRLAVAVDRGGRELPIQADYYGTKMNVNSNERVQVKIKDLDKEDSIWLLKRIDKYPKKLLS